MENTIEIEESKGKNKGFTLIELLIVIVILGILAAVTVFAVRGITDQGQTNACKADSKTLEVAVEAYFAQNAATAIPGADAEATLVTEGLLRSASTLFDVSSAGAVTATAGGDCA